MKTEDYLMINSFLIDFYDIVVIEFEGNSNFSLCLFDKFPSRVLIANMKVFLYSIMTTRQILLVFNCC